MRLDKYLKVSRLIKRRTVANEACDAGRVLVNGKPARASYDVKVGDTLTVQLGARETAGRGAAGQRDRAQGRGRRAVPDPRIKERKAEPAEEIPPVFVGRQSPPRGAGKGPGAGFAGNGRREKRRGNGDRTAGGPDGDDMLSL